MKRACLILPFFGKPPGWTEYFFKSLEYNTHYDWLIFTDIESFGKPYKNTRIIYTSLDDFGRLLTNKLKIKTRLQNPYKICDFKPAYGFVFSELLDKYEYWGYCDMDLILGNLDNFLLEYMDRGFDIISPEKVFFPGHFCLFRNNEFVNKLYQSASNLNEIYTSNKCYCFDEFLVSRGINISSDLLQKRTFIHVRKNRFKYLLAETYLYRVFYSFYIRLRGKYKKDKAKLLDFNHIISFFSDLGHLKTIKVQICDSDTRRFRLGFKNWEIQWDNGKLFNQEEKEILYFHFPLSKYNNSLVIKDLTTEAHGIFKVTGKI
jgi:hypothetical protein